MEEYELRNVCRACLTEEGEFYSMFVAEDISGLSLQLSEMMTSCTSIQVNFSVWFVYKQKKKVFLSR